MLDFIALSALTWLNNLREVDRIQPLELLPWEESAIFQLPASGQNSNIEPIVRAYLQKLTAENFDLQRQGIWVQSGWTTLASNRGQIPLPAASLTKIATTLAVLNKWGAKHQFMTDIYLTGEIIDGVVTGDLIVKGSGDPLFVWEEAIALGNALEERGISKIQGNLLITDEFYMNYEAASLKAGKLFEEAIDRRLWRAQITQQYLQMPVGTQQPEIAIAGTIQTIDSIPADARLLIRHRSLPLAEILRQMNIYSNNYMAQILTDLIGGADLVARSSAEIASFPLNEIELINGSGLGEENRISPRAVSQMLMAIDRLLQPHSFSAADLFPTAGRDFIGTVRDRNLPSGTTIKTGTLDRVSALAGIIPTGEGNNVYFSIINYGSPVNYFRQQQDLMLNEIARSWQLLPNEPELAREDNWYLGDPRRNELNRIN